jgi:hypothetical protein
MKTNMNVGWALAFFVCGGIITSMVDVMIGIDLNNDVGFMPAALHKTIYLLWGALLPIMILYPKGAARYLVLGKLNGISDIVKFEFPTKNEALQKIANDANDPDFTNIVLVDSKRRVVEMKKGDSIAPLCLFLDQTLPGGWDIGRI